MSLYSPLEDFMQRTMTHVPGIWAKLQYVASLREEEKGKYEHWGLARVFGDEPAQRALEQAHRNFVLQLLRTPLPVLIEEARRTAERHGIPLHEYVQDLNAQGDRLLPIRLGGGSAKHFSSVLLALSVLAVGHSQASTAATLQVS